MVVGFHRDFDYDELERLPRAVRTGACFVATNLDATYPVAHGMIPGTGAMVAAVATAVGARRRSRGSRSRRRSRWCAPRLGTTGVMVGDRPSTDGALATALGWPFALVLSGVTARSRPPAARRSRRRRLR